LRITFEESTTKLKTAIETMGWYLDLGRTDNESKMFSKETGDSRLLIETPIKDFTITIIGNLFYQKNIDPIKVRDPLKDSRGVFNYTIIFDGKIDEKLFKKLFIPLERKDEEFKKLFGEEKDYENGWFENLQPENIDKFLEAMIEYIAKAIPPI
jgi:hypothetical protein